MEINNSTLIIGPPKSGKTTFYAQLLARIQANIGQVKLTKSPEDFSGLQNACNRLADGLETETTPADENSEVILPVSIADKEFDLVCKDYGGEQIRNITDLLEYDNLWVKRAKSNDRWILFIRPSQLFHQYDLSLSGFAEMDENKEASKLEDRLSDQYHFMELLQALLHARGTSTKSRIETPKLLIVLTCWDELNTNDSPMKVLTAKMPFFHHFVNTLWQEGSFKVIGLSAQGFPLDNPEAQDKYLDELPESFGYLVLEENPKEPDLTRLIEIAINL